MDRCGLRSLIESDYYLRALALDPGNAMINLFLALGYLHHALKRQADNRQQILTQGLAFLMDYYDMQIHSEHTAQMQEAEYNVAHAYHLLGLVHLAIPHYERCLALQGSPSSLGPQPGGGIADEAALNLQGIWAVNGEDKFARDITERWLVM